MRFRDIPVLIFAPRLWYWRLIDEKKKQYENFRFTLNQEREYVMTHADLIFALESAIEANGLESVLRTLADTVSEKADVLSGDMGYGIDPENGEAWATAADMIRDITESLPDSTR